MSTNSTPIREGRWWRKFFDTLAETGIVTHSAKAAGVTRFRVYQLKRTSKEFAERWEQAERLGLAKLEDAAIERALATSDRLLEFLLKARLRERYGEVHTVEHSGTITYTIDEEAIEAAAREIAERRALVREPRTP